MEISRTWQCVLFDKYEPWVSLRILVCHFILRVQLDPLEKWDLFFLYCISIYTSPFRWLLPECQTVMFLPWPFPSRMLPCPMGLHGAALNSLWVTTHRTLLYQ